MGYGGGPIQQLYDSCGQGGSEPYALCGFIFGAGAELPSDDILRPQVGAFVPQGMTVDVACGATLWRDGGSTAVISSGESLSWVPCAIFWGWHPKPAPVGDGKLYPTSMGHYVGLQPVCSSLAP